MGGNRRTACTNPHCQARSSDAEGQKLAFSWKPGCSPIRVELPWLITSAEGNPACPVLGMYT